MATRTDDSGPKEQPIGEVVVRVMQRLEDWQRDLQNDGLGATRPLQTGMPSIDQAIGKSTAAMVLTTQAGPDDAITLAARIAWHIASGGDAVLWLLTGYDVTLPVIKLLAGFTRIPLDRGLAPRALFSRKQWDSLMVQGDHIAGLPITFAKVDDPDLSHPGVRAKVARWAANGRKGLIVADVGELSRSLEPVITSLAASLAPLLIVGSLPSGAAIRPIENAARWLRPEGVTLGLVRPAATPHERILQITQTAQAPAPAREVRLLCHNRTGWLDDADSPNALRRDR
jgi:hypothetical protein